MLNLLAWIVLGLIAGAIAKAIYPGHQGGGILATIILGILGALVGGWLGQAIFPYSAGAAGAAAGAFSIGSIIFAVLGAIILLFIWGLITRRTA